jgi:hypothetical protein
MKIDAQGDCGYMKTLSYKIKNIKKPGRNKGKKYNKPLSLCGMKLEEVVKLALKAKPAQ